MTAGGLGSQNAIGGGGRYDNLVESLGGRATPGVGFGSGIERLLIALEAQQVALTLPVRPLVFLVSPVSSEARLAQVVEAGSGFLYCVSLTGVTGARHGMWEWRAKERLRRTGY